jgi:hypothetical protein
MVAGGDAQMSRAARSVVRHGVVGIKGSGQRPWARWWCAIASFAGWTGRGGGECSVSQATFEGGGSGWAQRRQLRCSNTLVNMGQGRAGRVRLGCEERGCVASVECARCQAKRPRAG